MSNSIRRAGRIVTTIGYVMLACAIALLVVDLIALATDATHPVSTVGGVALTALFGLWGVRLVRNGRVITKRTAHRID